MINMNLLIYLFKDLYKQYRSKNIWTLVPYYMFKLMQGCVRVLLFMDSLKCAHKEFSSLQTWISREIGIFFGWNAFP